jgi:CheY-like chemotaxis protein
MTSTAPYRVLLQGFSDFERQALDFCFRHTAERSPGYALTASPADADLIVADGDSAAAVAHAASRGFPPQVLFIGRSAPAGTRWHLPRPIDPARLLRRLDELVAEHGPEIAQRRATPPAEPVDDKAHAAKAAARAASRRLRLAATAASHAAGTPLIDVLVLDSDAAACAPLCALLERFGFTVHRGATAAQAQELLPQRTYAAVFLDLALEGTSGGVGLELCRRVKRSTRTQPHTAVLVITAAQAQPADRVRATMAGAEALLLKPLGRGDVARTLEDNGVALPSDARRL